MSIFTNACAGLYKSAGERRFDPTKPVSAKNIFSQKELDKRNREATSRQIRNLEQQLDEAEVQGMLSADEVDRLKKELATTKSGWGNTKKELASTRSGLEGAKKELATTKSSLASTQKEFADFKSSPTAIGYYNMFHNLKKSQGPSDADKINEKLALKTRNLRGQAGLGYNDPISRLYEDIYARVAAQADQDAAKKAMLKQLAFVGGGALGGAGLGALIAGKNRRMLGVLGGSVLGGGAGALAHYLAKKHGYLS